MSFLKRKKRKNRFRKVEAESKNENTHNMSARPSVNARDDHISLNSGEIQVTQHERNQSINQIIMLSNSEFKNVKENSLIALFQDEMMILNNLHNALFVFKMQTKYLSDLLDNRDQKVSLDKQFSQRNNLNIKLYKNITLRWKVLNPESLESLAISKAEITFKGQYISMRDILEINKSLCEKLIMIGENISVKGFDLGIKSMTNKQGALVNFGIIKAGVTKINYFSLGARVVILVEISKNSFEFSNTGKLTLMAYLDFFKHYFGTLERMNNGHSIVVALFARVHYHNYINRNVFFCESLKKEICSSDMNTFIHGKNSAIFRDFFHKIYVPKRMLRDQCVALIKKEIFQFLKQLPVKQDYFDIIDFEKHEQQNHKKESKKGYQQSNGKVEESPFKCQMPTLSKKLAQTIERTNSLQGDKNLQDLGKIDAERKQHFFYGELSYSDNSCLLEAIALFLEEIDPSQKHKNLKHTGTKVIALVGKSSRFFVEEYFIRFLKLKLFLEDTNVSLVSFMDDEHASSPSFLALDDEYLLYKLRNSKIKIRKFSENDIHSEKARLVSQNSLDYINIKNNAQKGVMSKLQCNQFMVRLRDKGNLLIPTLNGCITRFKIKSENISNGRYFSKYMSKEIVDKYNLNYSEVQYFRLVKSYQGAIDIGEIEDNLIEMTNKNIFLKFPKFKKELEQVFKSCGHTHHRVLKRKSKFETKDYEKFNRFFKDKHLFRNFRFEDINGKPVKVSYRETELVKRFKENSYDSININSTFLNNLLTNLKNHSIQTCSSRDSQKKSYKSWEKRSSFSESQRRFTQTDNIQIWEENYKDSEFDYDEQTEFHHNLDQKGGNQSPLKTNSNENFQNDSYNNPKKRKYSKLVSKNSDYTDANDLQSKSSILGNTKDIPEKKKPFPKFIGQALEVITNDKDNSNDFHIETPRREASQLVIPDPSPRVKRFPSGYDPRAVSKD